MTSHDSLFGLYRPGDSVVHRAPLWLRYLALLAVSGAALWVATWWFSLAMLLVVLGVLALTRLPWRLAFAVAPGLWLLAGVLAAYQLVLGRPDAAVVVSANLVLCLYAARALTLTTPVPVLLDGLASLARPFRVVGVSPERLALAVGVMLRSIPFLVGAFGDVRDAARARGLGSNLVAQVSPVVVRSVGYALATGEALAARGLGDDEPTSRAPRG